MWSEVIRSTGLTSPAADWYFSKEGKCISVYDDRNEADGSFVATLRYLLFDKLNGETVKVQALNPGETVRGFMFHRRLARFYQSGDPNKDSYLLIINTYSAPEDMQEEFQAKYGFAPAVGANGEPYRQLLVDDSAFTEEVEYNSELITLNLKYQKSLTYFFGNKFGVYAFSDTEKHVTVVFTSRVNRQKYHWLQAVVPMLMPWYWADEEGKIVIEPEKLPLLEALNSTNVDSYKKIIEDFAKSLNLEEEYNNAKLTEFLNVSRNKALNNARSEITDLNERIDSYMQSIGEYKRMIDEKLAFVRGLEIGIENSGAEEFADYMRNNSAVTAVEFNGAFMRIICNGFFEYYDAGQLETYLDDKRSLVYGHAASSKLAGEKIKKLMKAIFIDEILKVRVCSSFTIEVEYNRIRATRDYDFPTAYKDYLPNPHIQHYACIGDYAGAMVEYVRNGNFVGAVEQCIASNQTMNFYDSTVTGNLVDDFVRIYSDAECIKLPDGTFTTVEKALEYLDAQAE